MKIFKELKKAGRIGRLFLPICLMVFALTPAFVMQAFASTDFYFLDMCFQLPDYYLDEPYENEGTWWRFDVYDDQNRNVAWLVFNACEDGADEASFDGQALLEDDLQYYEDVNDICWQDPLQVADMTADGVFFSKYDQEPRTSLEYTAYHAATGYTFWCCVTQASSEEYDYLQDVYDMLATAVVVESEDSGTAEYSAEESITSYSEDEEVQAAYETAYREQMDSAEEDIINYLSQYSEPSTGTQIAESFMDSGDELEEAYQQVNELDPGLYDAISDSAAVTYGSGPLSAHLIGTGVDAFFSDSELGQGLRETAWEGLGIAAGILTDLFLMSQEDYTDADSLQPLSINGKYALVRSYGSLYSLLDYVEEKSGYDNMKLAVDALKDGITDDNTFDQELAHMWSDAAVEDPDETRRIQLKWAGEDGKRQALEKYEAEYTLLVYHRKLDLLNGLGIPDAESLVEFPFDSDSVLHLENAGYSLQDMEEMIMCNRRGNLQDGFTELYGEDARIEVFNNSGDFVDLSEENAEQEHRSSYLNQCLYMVIDEDGYAYGAFLGSYSNLGGVIGEDGTCSLWNTSIDPRDDIPGVGHVIMDRYGMVLYENDIKQDTSDYSPVILDGSVIYYNHTPSGGILRKTYHKDFEHGEYQTVEYIDPEGKAAQLVEGSDVSVYPEDERWQERDPYEPDFTWYSSASDYIYSDIYRVYWHSFDGEDDYERLVDMKTGTFIDEDEDAPAEENKWAALLEEETFQDLSLTEVLNDRYALFSDNHVYDSDGKEAADFSSGQGVKSVHYADGLYWIMSNTGWYYILDDQFERILEPVEIGDLSYTLTDYGLLVENEEAGGVDLYDRTGKVAQNFPDTDLDDLDGFIFGNEHAGWFNLHTGEALLIRRPAEIVDVDL